MLQPQKTDVPHYTQKFLRHLKRQKYAEETLTGYGKDLKRFTQFLQQEYNDIVRMSDIQKEDILDYLTALEEEGLKPNSVNRHLSTIKALYKYLVLELDFPMDIGARIKQPNIYTPLREPLSFDEIEHFLQTAEKVSRFYFVFFSFLYHTGSRLTPVRTLRRENVDLQQQKVYFPRIKNGRDLHLPLTEKLYKPLAAFMLDYRDIQTDYVFPSSVKPNQPVSATHVRKKLRDLVKLAGIDKHVTPHLFRHSTGTHLTLLDVDQKFIASILGHSDLRSTARYQHLHVENLRPKLKKL
ncbi:tyrosine-type recombinase/integrase [Salibacterium qingdaonense]|uniref:Integrase/recombinase XerD n=1 Tax=Salibacterium qingdaonense TaxID=266892 RepID=A0A1I4NJJ1_9BACI|nr:tyrosine-type recombinase/integrase [Salibacterium qingdaonense]SFM15684.1 integrase/recombinase XerD [Salibacterium qingdaonense]